MLRNKIKAMTGVVEIGLIAIVLIAVGFVVFKVVGSDDAGDLNYDTQTFSELATIPVNVGEVKTMDDIVLLAGDDLPTDVTVVGFELDTEDGKTVYKVYLSNGTVLVYGEDGVLIDTEEKDLLVDHEALPAGFVASISLSEAIDTAKAEYPDSKVAKVELESEDGQVVFKVVFVDGTRVEVGATTGEVVRVKDASGEETFDANDDDSNDDSDEDTNDDSNDDGSDDSDDDSDNSGSDSGDDSDDTDDDSSDDEEDNN